MYSYGVGRNYFYEPFSSEFSLRLSTDCRETEVSFSRFSIFSEPVSVCYECVSFGLLSCWMFVDSSSRGIPSEFVLSQANSPAILWDESCNQRPQQEAIEASGHGIFTKKLVWVA